MSTFFDDIKEALGQHDQIELLKGQVVSDIEFHEEIPEYPRTSAEGVTHFVRVDNSDNKLTEDIQYSLQHIRQQSVNCPEFGIKCTKHTYECRACYICKHGEDSFKSASHSSVNLKSAMYQQNDFVNRRGNLLYFIQNSKGIKCNSECKEKERLVVPLRDNPLRFAVACPLSSAGKSL